MKIPALVLTAVLPFSLFAVEQTAPKSADIKSDITVQAPEARLTHALKLYDQGENEQALNELQNGLRATLSNPNASSHATYALFIDNIVRFNKQLGQQPATVELLQQVINEQPNTVPATLISSLYNDLGKSQLEIGEYESASTSFDSALRKLSDDAEPLFRVRLRANYINALIESGKPKQIGDQAKQAIKELAALPASTERAEAQLAIAYLLAYAPTKVRVPDDFRLDASNLIRSALSDTQQDARLSSFGDGTMGQLYEQERRFDEALLFTRRALFNAQTSNAKDLEFRWEWQLGRLLNAKNEKAVALAAYERAFSLMTDLRQRLISERSDTFNTTILPMYSEYVDVLTQHIKSIGDDSLKQAKLASLRTAIEQLKVAEVEDYFQSACFDDNNEDKQKTALQNNAVVIYPVILDDRVELLVQRGSQYKLYSAVAKKEQVANTIRTFREVISNYKLTQEYREYGQQLYSWFVKPYESDLQSNDTLIFVAAWMLRTIPLAALHDGQQFLIEKFPLITTPSMKLTSFDSANRKKIKVLVNGITESVQGYDALPSVASEIESIAKLYDAVVLKDQAFSVERAKSEISAGEYGIVHVATHGEFDSDFRKSYILGYDDKIRLSSLEKTILARRFAEKPIDLLVLSACQTAAGDDRAALGLAGVAVKAGARSALATLWFISDAATSVLVSQFYGNLRDVSLNKAQALQLAQIELIKTDRYSHPNFWAPFVLIGNWQ